MVKLEFQLPDFQKILETFLVGGLMVFIIEDIPSKLISVEAKPVELDFQKKRWIFKCFYDIYKDGLSNRFAVLRNSLKLYTSLYGNMILHGVSIRR